MKTAFILGFIFVFLASNLALSNRSVRDALSSVSEINYDFIYLDWIRKLEFLNDPSKKDATLFIGTSRTSYGIDPESFGESARNLGFFSSSLIQIESALGILDAMPRREGEKRRILVELNPIAFTDSHIEMVSAIVQDPLLLAASQGAKWPLPLFALPIVRYKNLLSSAWLTLLNPNLALSPQTKELRRAERLQIDSEQYRGFVDAGENRATADSLAECHDLVEMSLGDGKLERWSREIDQVLESAANLQIRFWIPPKHPRFELPLYDVVNSRIQDDLRQRGIAASDVQDVVSEDDFFDCIHLNASGAKKVSERLRKDF